MKSQLRLDLKLDIALQLSEHVPSFPARPPYRSRAQKLNPAIASRRGHDRHEYAPTRLTSQPRFGLDALQDKISARRSFEPETSLPPYISTALLNSGLNDGDDTVLPTCQLDYPAVHLPDG